MEQELSFEEDQQIEDIGGGAPRFYREDIFWLCKSAFALPYIDIEEIFLGEGYQEVIIKSKEGKEIFANTLTVFLKAGFTFVRASSENNRVKMTFYKEM